ENLAEGWSLAEKDGITGLVPESYITFTTEFTELHNTPLSPSSSSLSSLSPPLLSSSPPPLSSDSDSINSTTLMSSPLSTTTEVIVNGSTTTTTPSSARNSTILGRRQLNRFSWFVTTGVEEFILSGGQPLLTSENHSSDDNVHHHQIERSEDEDEEQITESDKHYIESGPSWQEKAPTFKVLVHNPEKRVKLGGVQEYTIFYVTSLFTEGAQVTVERRFSQFEWLHRHLAAKFSAFILPPLPEKQYAERYINRLARHPVIRYSDLLTHFLSCENDNEWYKREKQFESDQIIGHVFFQHVYHPEYNVDDGDVETIERFEAHSRAMEKLMPFINEASQSHKDSVDEMQKQYRKVSYALLKLITGHNLGEGYEMLNEEGAWCWRDGCQACLSLTKALQSIAESMQSIANIYETYSNETCMPWLEHMKDYSYPASNYEPLIDMHTGTYRKFKEVSDENANHQLLEEVDLETVKSRCDTVFNVTLAEVDRIHEERVQDFREVTRQYLDGQIEFHEKVLEELRQARANFDEPHYSSLSQTPLSEIVGGVVADGVDSLNNFLRRTTRNSISRSTVLDMWWNRNTPSPSSIATTTTNTKKESLSSYLDDDLEGQNHEEGDEENH
ncbi:6457_t:CDS:10, partial [Entrophospora sp. SA101]